MSMNVGSMMRALMGELQSDSVRALELRVGQIVRGVLLEMLDNHEALMNINGVQVRAKLDTELPVGTGTLLQVQPGSDAGTLTLKPLAEPVDLPADDVLKDVVKSFGLPDQKWSLEMLRGLKRDGYPIGKETAAYFQSAAALKPAGTDTQSWTAAADVAFRRGLNLSQHTLGSLRQALFGPPMHEQMADLAEALKQWQAAGDGKSPASQGISGRLQGLLALGETLLLQGEAQLLAGTGESLITDKPSDLAAQKQALTQPAQPRSTEGKPLVSSARADAVVTAASVAVNPDSMDRGAAGAEPRSTAAEAPVSRPAQAAPQGNKLQEPETAGRQAAVQPMASESAAAPPANVPRGDAAWIGRFLQWLGAGHENSLLRAGADMRMPADQQQAMAGQTVFADAGQGAHSEHSSPAADSLKSALLTLAAHEETPPALRESAQSLVSQITGQQLLLSTERQPNAPYSVMTLFVPMKGRNGDTTATVHVQTRRGRRGEWDTDNCRLLFDLRMRHLGDTVVDVQVVDRIVSLKLMNDHPGMGSIVDNAREELSAGLHAAGFQLLSVSAVPLPSYQNPADSENSNDGEKPEPAKASSAYTAKKYKGVDFRV